VLVSTRSPEMNSFTLKGRFVQGLGAQGLSMILEIGQRFLLVPLYLLAWPMELYGEWLVIQAAAMLLPLADLGIMPYFSNAMAMAWARGDRVGFERLQRVAFGLYAVLLAVAVPAYVLAVVLIARAGGFGDGAMTGETRALVWLLLGLYHILVIPHGVLTGIYRARTSFALDMYAIVLKESAVLVAVVAALVAGASPVLVAAAHLAMGVAVYAPIVAEQRRRYPDLRHGFALPTRAEFRSFVGHLGWFTVLPVGDRLIANGPILVLGLVASEAAVVVFSTLRILSGIIRTASERVSYLAGAEMANLFARGERERLVQLYLFTGRLAIGVAGFAAGALYAVAEPFLAVWTGGKVPYDDATLVALLAALVFGSHGHICYQLLRYTNRPRAVLPLVMARALTSLTFGGALATAYGPAGMAAGLTLSEVTLMGLLLPLRLHRVDGLPLWPFLGRNLLTVALAFGASLATAEVLVGLIGDRDLLHLVLVGVLWAALTVPPALFLLLDADHRAWLLSGAQRALRRTARRPASSP
jgi:O-antigen/teichoic acid export membrane protein